jgi:hypothetical protein
MPGGAVSLPLGCCPDLCISDKDEIPSAALRIVDKRQQLPRIHYVFRRYLCTPGISHSPFRYIEDRFHCHPAVALSPLAHPFQIHPLVALDYAFGSSVYDKSVLDTKITGAPITGSVGFENGPRFRKPALGSREDEKLHNGSDSRATARH